MVSTRMGKGSYSTTSHLQVCSPKSCGGERKEGFGPKPEKNFKWEIKREPVQDWAHFLKENIQMPDYRLQNGPVEKLGKINEKPIFS